MNLSQQQRRLINEIGHMRVAQDFQALGTGRLSVLVGSTPKKTEASLQRLAARGLVGRRWDGLWVLTDLGRNEL